MKARLKPNSSVFNKIKRTLDPDYSYVIFEKTAGSTDEGEFHEVFEVISCLKLDVFGWKIHRDKTEGKALLVVKVDPGRTDNLLEKFFKAGISKDIAFYSFGSRT